MSGQDLAREPGLGEQMDCRLGEMPLSVRPNSSVQPLFGSKRSRHGPGPSWSVDFSTAAPPSKKVKMNEIKIQTAEKIKTLDKKKKFVRNCTRSWKNTRREPRNGTNGRRSTMCY